MFCDVRRWRYRSIVSMIFWFCSVRRMVVPGKKDGFREERAEFAEVVRGHRAREPVLMVEEAQEDLLAEFVAHAPHAGRADAEGRRRRARTRRHASG